MALKSLRALFQRLPADGEIRHALREFNLGMMGGGTIPSVRELARRLGYDVFLVDMPKKDRGRLVRDQFAKAGFRIEVNQSDDVETRRWTVLHELMHGLIHRREELLAWDQYRAVGDAHFYSKSDQREETEANSFVEALIFGDGALFAAISLYGVDKEKLTRRFGVSIKTLEIAVSKL